MTDNTTTCEAKRGFFTLYDCPKPADETCNKCKRKLCHEHKPLGDSLCLECVAKGKTIKKSEKEEVSARDHLVNAYVYRNKALHDNKGTTIYFGHELTSYYSAFDLRSFDIELSRIAEMTDSPDEIFFDS